MDIVLWLLGIVLMAVGVLGTVLPALPGVVLVFLGAWLMAWIDDYQRVSIDVVVLLGGLTVLAWVLDYLAALLGARNAGASRQALAGAAIGTVIGLFMGLVGVLLMPFVGAVIGEFMARRDHARSLQVGVATWLGLIVGLIAKVAIVFMMLGIFLVALLL